VLIKLMSSPVQNGASRLLKMHLESGGETTLTESEQLFQLLTYLSNWESKLHLLQLIQYVPISPASKPEVEGFLRDSLVDENNFVRAWAYDGFYRIASQYPEYREEVRKFFQLAHRDEAPSVLARLRQILKKDDWL
jgi:hypothetical protein